MIANTTSGSICDTVIIVITVLNIIFGTIMITTILPGSICQPFQQAGQVEEVSSAWAEIFGTHKFPEDG